MLIVGLTGGVASGKTAISQILREEGAYLIDADQIARELVQPHTATWNELIKVFGKEILQEDGSIHRKRLAAKVFSDPEQRNLLNQILHPRIKTEMNKRVKEIGQKDPNAIVVIDAALLIELGGHREMDRVIVVASTEKQQIERLKKRDGVDQEEAQKILSSQMPLDEKMKVADFVIRNEGSFEETRRRVKEVFQKLKNIAFQRRDQPEFKRPAI
ncbi:MAG: dephospho-CoA kinase [Acidobacteriia bacterium]|nr:dephospho-CoA kinase [Terriglobia bacterium]